jgi:hypothetical protein
MTIGYNFSFSRHTAPEFCNYVRPRKIKGRATLKRGRGECRVSDAPVAAQNAVVFHRFTGIIPAFPAQWFTVSFALSPVIGLSCHRRP